MSKQLTQKALINLAKSRLTGSDAKAAEMFLLAVKLGIPSAEATFQGYGDSGQFDDPTLEDFPRHIRDETKDNWSYIPNPKWTPDHDRLKEMVKEAAKEWVDGTGEDWYNNDGGGGSVSFDFKTGEVSGHVYQNVTSQNTVATNEWNLLGDDEEGGEE